MLIAKKKHVMMVTIECNECACPHYVESHETWEDFKEVDDVCSTTPLIVVGGVPERL